MMPPTPSGTRRFVTTALLACVAWLAPAASTGAAPAEPTPIMPLDDVRIGMKGYGLTVFHGTTIEPFAVEVVSVMPNADPKRGVIWIRADHPRLAVAGPVQGMSGSPIYLWEEGEEGEVGEGGRLIGAFAFGFSGVKEPLAGVQPIEYMRQTAQRASEAGEAAEDGQPPAQAQSDGGRQGLATLEQLARSARIAGLDDDESFRLAIAQRVMRQATGKRRGAERTGAFDAPPPPPAPGGPGALDGEAVTLSLPMTVDSAATARMLAPLFDRTRIMPVAAPGGAMAGKPPHGTDMEAPIQPGSVLSVPLAFGDVDLSAAGTTTDVLPDGTVLGFGHPLFGDGPATVPMASGYVHFTAPRITISFKQAGSLKILGSIVRDESAAVAGIDQAVFNTAPVRIEVAQPGLDRERYDFELVHHDRLTPALLNAVYAQSVAAIHAPPARSTLRLSGSMSFEGDRTVTFDTTVPSGNPQAVLMEVLPALTLATQNPFRRLRLTAARFKLEVTDGLLFTTIDTARAQRRTVHPGDTLAIDVQLLEFEGQPVRQRVELPLPDDLEPGEYQVMVGDANRYTQGLFQSRPYLFEAEDVDDVMAIARQSLTIERKALYVMLQTSRPGLSVGRQNLSDLPSSRAALIRGTAGSGLTEFSPMIDAVVPMSRVIQGQVAVPIRVIARPAD